MVRLQIRNIIQKNWNDPNAQSVVRLPKTPFLFYRYCPVYSEIGFLITHIFIVMSPCSFVKYERICKTQSRSQ